MAKEPINFNLSEVAEGGVQIKLNRALRFAHNCLPLMPGWWIVDCGKRTVLGYSFDDWKTMSDEDFRRTYERCD